MALGLAVELALAPGGQYELEQLLVGQLDVVLALGDQLAPHGELEHQRILELACSMVDMVDTG